MDFKTSLVTLFLLVAEVALIKPAKFSCLVVFFADMDDTFAQYGKALGTQW